MKPLSQKIGKYSLGDLLLRHAVEPILLFPRLFLRLNGGLRLVSRRGSIILGDHETVVVVADTPTTTRRDTLGLTVFKIRK